MRTTINVFGRACAIVLAAAGVVVAQSPRRPPVFRSAVSLVTVDVTVVDATGVPVRDLTAADFIAKINGTERPVQTLDLIQFGVAAKGDAASPVDPGTAAGPVSRNAQTLLLVFDDLSFTPGAGKGMAAAVARLLTQLDPAAMVGLVATSGLGPNVSPTRDRAVVEAAVATLVGSNVDSAEPFVIGTQEAINIERGFIRDALKRVADRECPIVFPGRPVDQCADMIKSRARVRTVEARRRVEQQLSSFHQVVNALAQAPAPRVVVVMTAGVSLAAELDMREPLSALSDAAASAGVQLYALVDEGDLVDMSDTSETRATVRRTESRLLSEGMSSVATATGGHAFRMVGQADRLLARVVSETSAIYRLGIEAPDVPAGAPILRADVSVRRRGVTVRSTGRALAAAPTSAAAAAPLSREDAMKLRLSQGGDVPLVPLRLAARVRRHDAQGLQLMVDARVPSTVAAPIELLIGLVNGAGTMVFAGRRALGARTDGRDHHLLMPIAAPPGTYRLRLVAGDAADAIGSVDIPVVVGLTRLGDFDVSDVMVMYPSPDGRDEFSAFEETVPGATEAVVSLELYPSATRQPDTSTQVRLMITRGDDVPVVERRTVPVASLDRWTASAALPLQDLAPGRYQIRATVTQGDVTLGSVTRVLVVR